MGTDLIFFIGTISFVVILITLFKLSRQLDTISDTQETLGARLLSLQQQADLNSLRIKQKLDIGTKDILAQLKSKTEKEKEEIIREYKRTRDL